MSTLQKVRYPHDAMIDEIIIDPNIKQGELARRFNRTEAWISIIVNSDAFKFRLKERKAELVDPQIRASVEERLDAVAKRALDKLLDRLEGKNGPNMSDNNLIQAAKLGVGNKNALPAPMQQNNLYVVNMPPPAKNATEWLSSTQAPGGVPQITENSPGVYSPPEGNNGSEF